MDAFTDSLHINADAASQTLDSAEFALEQINGKAVSPVKILYGQTDTGTQITDETPLPTHDAAIGTTADAIWSGTGAATVIAALKSTADWLSQIFTKLSDVLTVQVDNLPSTYPTGESPLTDQQLRASAVQVSNTDDSFLMRTAIKVLSKFTFTTNGARVDVSAGTITTVSTVTACNGVAQGRLTTDGQGIQNSQICMSNTFRRNLLIS